MKVSNATSNRTARDASPPESRNAASSSSIKGYTLDGPAPDLDPLYHAYRGDLADIALAGKLFVPHYAVPQVCTASVDSDMRSGPLDNAELVGRMDGGTEFLLLDIIGDWGWGYRASDHMVGYVRTTDLNA